MPISREAREQWGHIVDAVAGVDSTKPLPRQYVSTQYLPDNAPLPPELIRVLHEEDGDFDSEAAEWFKQQISDDETFYARPLRPTFTRDTATIIAAGKEEGDHPDSAAKEGPDFYRVYRCMGGGGSNAVRANPTSGVPSQLTSGFIDRQRYALTHRQPDFMPIILVPSSITSPLQLLNIKSFLEEGNYIDPPTLFVDAETGIANIQDTKPDSVIVSPGPFLDKEKYTVVFSYFRILDNPDKVDNWEHVCACVVDGKEWQLEKYFPGELSARQPSELFSRVRGFLPYFEEDKIPKALRQWRVQPLVLSRRLLKKQQHIKQAFVFWEQLYLFLDEHPMFKLYNTTLDE
ncbi:unnamed protein product [Phytomonas sp. Hart1]|nr:unnamed protein product [Phytomonas sp. Hart1]|eukprot:CCW69234.1 unnamed protein product [Phytomonas sp. isolate Hart1]